jgi:hypothetical protein
MRAAAVLDRRPDPILDTARRLAGARLCVDDAGDQATALRALEDVGRTLDTLPPVAFLAGWLVLVRAEVRQHQLLETCVVGQSALPASSVIPSQRAFHVARRRAIPALPPVAPVYSRRSPRGITPTRRQYEWAAAIRRDLEEPT